MKITLRHLQVANLVIATVLLVACGGGGGGGGGSSLSPPSSLSYMSPVSAVEGTAISPLSPKVTGTAASYSIDPMLPAGLNIDATSGVISGTPSATAPQRTYTVTARNSAGSTTFTLTLTVNLAAPSQLSYQSPETLDVGMNLSLTPTVSGVVASYSITPELPHGIALNTTTGVMSGFGRESRASQIYTITATNAAGSTTFPLDLAVQSSLASPASFSYSPFDINNPPYDGQPVTRYVWEGRNVVLLSRDPNLNPGVMQIWLDALDKAYDYYLDATGLAPTPAKTYNGKLTMADVPSTCGAGCGYLGFTGIEGASTYFDQWYGEILQDGQFDQAFFYELGRNFWFYSAQVGYFAPDDSNSVVTGYAVLMRFQSMEAGEIAGAPFPTPGGTSFAQFYADVQGLVDLYVADQSLTWSNTLPVDQGVPDHYGGTDLFASFLMSVKRDHGGDAFMRQLWKEVALRPSANSTQDAVDNMVLAACAASGENLTALFTDTFRWPLSDAAKGEAQMRFGPPI